MKLSVYVNDQDVATLESQGDFRSVLTYHPDVSQDDFVSLTMPVRVESHIWDAPLHPIFRMNLPEGYLLQILQEELGPHISGNPLALLAVVGRNMIGRIKVAHSDAEINASPHAFEVVELLQGDNSEEMFIELVKRHAKSGVSGVIPKFLDAQESDNFTNYKKGTIITHKHIIKGSSNRLPFIALNEHLCMHVAKKVIETAHTEVSQDGKALVVHRFDVNEDGQPIYGMEDFCALLGLEPSKKYDTTWERIAKAVRDHVPGTHQLETFKKLTTILLLNYALRNSDCHSKNIALRYTSRKDVHLSPVYDMLTTQIYDDTKDNPPGISFMGKKTWMPGKNLQNFIKKCFGVSLREQQVIIEQISDAVSDSLPKVEAAIEMHPEFKELGKRMLKTWDIGVSGLRDKKTYSLSQWKSSEHVARISDPPKLNPTKDRIGESDGLGKR